MLKPLAMCYVSLQVLTEDAPLAAQVLADYGLFNPEKTEALAQQLPDRPGAMTHQLFRSAQSRLDKILACIPFTPPARTPGVYQLVERQELENINEQLGEIWQQFSDLEEQQHQLQEQQANLKQLIETLEIFSHLDIDLQLLQSPKQFLNVHIGTTPAANVAHLRASIALAEHVMQVFHQDEYRAYFVIAGPLHYQKQIESVLEHADFQPLTLPAEFRDYPQQVRNDLSAQMQHTLEAIATLQSQRQRLAEQHHIVLLQAYQTLNRVSAYATLTDTLRSKGQLALIAGWVPQADLAALETALKVKLARPFVLNSRQPTRTEYAQVPSLLRHHPLLAPFVTLVKNYGIPRYGEFDPTWLFALTFIAMFGAMFGDVGHGAVIAGGGWYGRDKLKQFTPFLILAGFSSMVFGFLYGSVFGFETVLPALWLSPIHHPTLMLTMALYWGIGFILLATLLTVINRWQAGHYTTALLDNTGLMGIALYLGGFYAAQQWMTTGQLENSHQLAVFLPLGIILGYKWHENKLPLAERLLVTLIEGLESIINYLANTLSFLRVAAFSLNHAALAIAVFTLADGLIAPASWLTIILGNLFIVVLEGFIVTIQVLRLEYYEGFSRFFSGDGRAFHPLKWGVKL